MHEDFIDPSGFSSRPVSMDDQLVRVFNTALISTRARSNQDLSRELQGVIQSKAFQAVLSATRDLARTECISDQEAAEFVIRAFRKIDQIWKDYVFHEGIDKLKGAQSPSGQISSNSGTSERVVAQPPTQPPPHATNSQDSSSSARPSHPPPTAQQQPASGFREETRYPRTVGEEKNASW